MLGGVRKRGVRLSRRYANGAGNDVRMVLILNSRARFEKNAKSPEDFMQPLIQDFGASLLLLNRTGTERLVRAQMAYGSRSDVH